MPATVLELLASAKERLARAPFEAPRREANLLLAHVLERSEVWLLAHDDAEVEAAAAMAFEELISRRLKGEPVAYLTGRREFFGRPFEVDSRVLVPRPETEHLITTVLDLDLPDQPRILDLGTGSGCIAVTLALELPGARVLACDRSLAALDVAGRNATALVAAVQLFCGDWLSAVDIRQLDLVISNPPYISQLDGSTMSPEITGFEPHSALFAGDDGLDAYRELFQALTNLQPSTPVVCEIGQGQAPAVVELAHGHGFAHLRTVDDYARIPRVVVVKRL